MFPQGQGQVVRVNTASFTDRKEKNNYLFTGNKVQLLFQLEIFYFSSESRKITIREFEVK